MAENRLEVVVGAATLILAAGFLAYAAQTTGFGGGSDRYALTASFRSAEGVGPGTAVRLAGVRVGTVTDLNLNKETFRADMTLAIDADLEVPEDSSIAISSEGLLGGSFVEIVPGGSPFSLEPEMAFEDTQGALSLIGLLAQFVNAATGD